MLAHGRHLRRMASTGRSRPADRPVGCHSAIRPACGSLGLSVAQLRLALGPGQPDGRRPRGQRRPSSLDAARTAAEGGADLAAVPGDGLTGYPVEDLALRPSFVEASRGRRDRPRRRALAAEGLGDVAGRRRLPRPRRAARPTSSAGPRGAPQNAAAVLHDGAVVARYAKHHLPNYGVFDEFRYFVPGHDTCVVRVRRRRRRARHLRGPLAGRRPGRRLRARSRAGLLLVPQRFARTSATRTTSGSSSCSAARPRPAARSPTSTWSAARTSWSSTATRSSSRADGEVLARAPAVRRGPARRRPRPARGRPPTARRRTHVVGRAEVAPSRTSRWSPARRRPHRRRGRGLRRAGHSGCATTSAKNGFHVASCSASRGGIDSALVAAIAVRRARRGATCYGVAHAERVLLGALARPTPPSWPPAPACTSASSRSSRWCDAFVDALGLTGLAEENVQARVRGTIAHGHCRTPRATSCSPPATRASSPSATRRSTATPSAASRRSRTYPRRWSGRWRAGATPRPRRAARPPPIPETSIAKPPSAELRPGQVDTDSLPDVRRARRRARRLRRAATAGPRRWSRRASTPSWSSASCGMVDAAEWKRRQYPPGPKISLRAFGRDRRLPITNRWREKLS